MAGRRHRRKKRVCYPCGVSDLGFLSVEPRENVARYLTGRADQSKRYASWDHCFNYFRTAHDEQRLGSLTSGEELQNTCLQLGFYLASWGMYRGKAPLLKQSAYALSPLVKVVASAPSDLWKLDVENYDEKSVKLLMIWANKVRDSLPGTATDTLVTKAMLGVFGNVPAFDRYYRVGIDSYKLNETSLKRVKTYFDHHQDSLKSLQIPTIDFNGDKTKFHYTQAKIIDMIFFVAGGGMGPNRIAPQQ